MKVAVVGAGMAGFALTWNLLQRGCEVDLFDDASDSASAASTGLLHPYPGKEAARAWRADEAMIATKRLLEAVSGDGAAYAPDGILRLGVTEPQRLRFKDYSCDFLPSLAPSPAMWIPEGITVYSIPYLNALRTACAKAHIYKHRVSDLRELQSYDLAILACGVGVFQFEECRHLPLKRAIGQALICKWPERLPMALLASGHIATTEDPHYCQLGSTYEHTAKPDPNKALALLDRCAKFYPPAKDFEIVEIRHGTRVSPLQGARPMIVQLNENTWVFTGLGSRGLLYHALLAEELVDRAVRALCLAKEE